MSGDIVAGASWSAQDDIELHKMQASGSTVKLLAAHFKRGEGAIRSRLKHLTNPEHKAYQRLFGTLVELPPMKKQKTTMTVDGTNTNPSLLPAAAAADTKGGTGSSSSSSGTFVTGGESTTTVPLISADSLTPSQRDIAHRAIHTDGNVFLTGAAGWFVCL